MLTQVIFHNLIPRRTNRRPLGQQLRSVRERYRAPLALCGDSLPRRAAAKEHQETNSGPAASWARDEPLARLEAALFLAREPLTTRRLAWLAGLTDGTAARTLVRRLNHYYDEAGSAFRAEEVAGGFQLLSRPQFGVWLRHLSRGSFETRLSAPALETLAVVAYRQPVLRGEIEKIRGVESGEMLRQLMDRDLVRISGRSDELGSPYLYGTTKRFLQVFGLRNLDDLSQTDVLPSPPTADSNVHPA